MTAHIGQRIDRRYVELSPQEQRVADFILDHFDDLAVYNGAELARLTGVSKATVTRLFKRLGFSSFREVKEHARALRNQGVPLASSQSENTSPQGFISHFEREQRNLKQCLDALSGARFQQSIKLLGTANRVQIIGFRNSYPVALHLRQQLIQSRDRVLLAPQPGQSVGEEIASLESSDVVVLFGFRRRPKGFSALLSTLAKRQVPIIMIADSTARRYAEKASVWLEIPVDSVSAFDSYGSAMSIMSLLANGVLHAHLAKGRKRIARISDDYALLDELDEEAPKAHECPRVRE